ncbi:hypothetical protein ElyMa_000146100 [Elysia marginata]|uniref:Uncharacterized protein n=1 Tax=Elysia marginata TaxID=1093978 RepID=A0AAV4EQK0_9GAST|nr:hypothetical protein ElyMa_000146100 [Elysia marginata]
MHSTSRPLLRDRLKAFDLPGVMYRRLRGEITRHEMPLPPSAGCASTAFLTHAPFTAFDGSQRSRLMLDFAEPGLVRPRTCGDPRESLR